MHPHATQSPLTYTYALPAMYIHNYIRIAQSETLYTNDHLLLKRVASITTTAKRNFTRSQKNVSLKNSTPCMWYIQYERILMPCMNNSAYNRLMRLRRVNGCLCTLKAPVSVIRLKKSSSCFHHLCDVLKMGG